MNRLQFLLQEIVDNDRNYSVRQHLVYEAMLEALRMGLDAGVRIDTNEPEWPVVFIQLPTMGQVSWHQSQFMHVWDNHNAEQKMARISEYVQERGI